MGQEPYPEQKKDKGYYPYHISHIELYNKHICIRQTKWNGIAGFGYKVDGEYNYREYVKCIHPYEVIQITSYLKGTKSIESAEYD